MFLPYLATRSSGSYTLGVAKNYAGDEQTASGLRYRACHAVTIHSLGARVGLRPPLEQRLLDHEDARGSSVLNYNSVEDNDSIPRLTVLKSSYLSCRCRDAQEPLQDKWNHILSGKSFQDLKVGVDVSQRKCSGNFGSVSLLSRGRPGGSTRISRARRSNRTVWCTGSDTS